MWQWPEYNKNDTIIFFSMLPVVVVTWNSLLFGKRYFTEADVFIYATVVTFLVAAFSWHTNRAVGVFLRNRLPANKDFTKRVAISLALFLLMVSLTITFLFHGYDRYHFLGYSINETDYQWALIISCVVTTFVAFLYEGVRGFEKWNTTIKETEQLKKEYMRSQLLGLKSQVSPHYLFNSLNTLSSLISEDQEAAEKFLDEMSKVYRYLLRNSEEQFVSLKTELQFIESYFHLLKIRHSDGISLKISVDEEAGERVIPPLTLQIILENIFNMNMISRERPLEIEISAVDGEWLVIKNNIQRKIGDDQSDAAEDGLENISNKFRLLSQQSMKVKENGQSRIIELPLIRISNDK